LSLLELAEYLKNVSEACKINGDSRQHFYEIKKASSAAAKAAESPAGGGGSRVRLFGHLCGVR
jgi:hypothetical protein